MYSRIDGLVLLVRRLSRVLWSFNSGLFNLILALNHPPSLQCQSPLFISIIEYRKGWTSPV